ncbi:MAG: hypothetical protein ACUVQY_02810 [Thermoproteota archaeon]
MEDRSSALRALKASSFLLLLTLTFFHLGLTTLTEASPQNITVYYFITEECPHCIRVREFVNSISEEYPNFLFREFNLFGNNTAVELFINLADSFDMDEGSRVPPVVFIGELYLAGEDDIVYNLKRIMFEYDEGLREYRDKAGELIKGFIENQTSHAFPPLLRVIVAAFVDSLNPCAFATMVLLLTYSLSSGSSRSMLITCGAFILGVLISYLSAGIGLLYVISMAPLRISLRYLVGSVAILFSILEFKEFLFYGKGLSLEQPSVLNRILGKYSTGMTVGAGFLIGVAVSMVELPCTGGIYLTILYLLSKIGFTLEVFMLLLLYNLIFILPLIIILLLVYLGRNVMEIDAWRIEKRRYMRLLAGILLLVTGVAIIAGVI